MRYAVIARYPTGCKVEGDFSTRRAATQLRDWLTDPERAWTHRAMPLDTCVVGFERRIEPGTERVLRSKPQPATLSPMGV